MGEDCTQLKTRIPSCSCIVLRVCFLPAEACGSRSFFYFCESVGLRCQCFLFGFILLGETQVVQLLNCVQLFATPWTAACQASLSFTISWSLLKLLSIELVMPSNHLTLCRPLLLLPSIFSSIWVFSNWLFPSGGQSISPSSENSGLISFSIYWFKLFAVQGTLKNLLQYHSSKASVLQWSGFFMVQLLHPYMTTGKTITLTRWTFVSKIMSLLFNTLSRFVMAFLPRSKCLLISWLQSPSAVIL